MEDLLATLFGIAVFGMIIVLLIINITSFIRLIIRKSIAFKKWLRLSPEKRKNNRKMNRTIKRLRKESKYGSSSYSGGEYSYSSDGGSGDGGGGCD